jgi:chromosome segregation ATPase
MTDQGGAAQRTYWIIEWAFVGSEKWRPIDHPPFSSETTARSRRRKPGFQYRITEFVPAELEQENAALREQLAHLDSQKHSYEAQIGAIQKILDPYFGPDNRDTEFDVLPSSIARIVARVEALTKQLAEARSGEQSWKAEVMHLSATVHELAGTNPEIGYDKALAMLRRRVEVLTASLKSVIEADKLAADEIKGGISSEEYERRFAEAERTLGEKPQENEAI